jgi:hypothetical protein
MSIADQASIQGRVTVRPWRIALLVDIDSPNEVDGAFRLLSSVWGGIYMPIFDAKATPDEIRQRAEWLGVDSLYCENPPEELKALTNEAGLAWRGTGRFGPFRVSESLTTGLLRSDQLSGAFDGLVIPSWADNDPHSLFYATLWGAPLSAEQLADGNSMPSYPLPTETVSGLLLSGPDPAAVGLLAATGRHLSVQPSAYGMPHSAVHVVKPDSPRDLVRFWNARTLGGNVVALPDDLESPYAAYLLGREVPNYSFKTGTSTEISGYVLPVIGLDGAGAGVRSALDDVATRRGFLLREESSDDIYVDPFRGLRTPFVQYFQTTVEADGSPAAAPLPPLPVLRTPDHLLQGMVAAEIDVHAVRGQDPRFTSALPPFRRQASLLPAVTVAADVACERVTDDGVLVAVRPNGGFVPVPFVYRLEVFRALFDDPAVEIDQSANGRFQQRAAQVLGGEFTQLFNQPGLRSAVEVIARRDKGAPFAQARNEVLNNRGHWPDLLSRRGRSDTEYANDTIRGLLHTGLIVPIVDVHCGYCRIESQVTADELRTVNVCEFCGHSTNWALSMALKNPEWKYRLASHMTLDRARDLMAVLSTASTVAQASVATGADICAVLGLHVLFPCRQAVEIDFAGYFPHPTGAVVIGEIKGHTPIDANDVVNLEAAQNFLESKKVTTIVLFGTLNDELSRDEKQAIRDFSDRRARALRSSRGQIIPHMPLVLTGEDLSLPWGNDAHPWRWNSHHEAPGLFGTAIASCRKNLGLASYTPTGAESWDGFTYEWTTAGEVAAAPSPVTTYGTGRSTGPATE